MATECAARVRLTFQLVRCSRYCHTLYTRNLDCVKLPVFRYLTQYTARLIICRIRRRISGHTSNVRLLSPPTDIHPAAEPNQTSASRLPLSGFGQPGHIAVLVLPLGGMASRHRK
ncbi:hypothetical protein CSKR_111676, partial [Clonorchis sinensis]